MEMVIERNMCDKLIEVTRKNSDEGYKIFTSNLQEDLKKMINNGSETMTSTKQGKSQRYRFVNLKNLTDETRQKIQAVKESFVSFFNTAEIKIEEDLHEAGDALVSGWKTDR